jgi:hypothetical protein
VRTTCLVTERRKGRRIAYAQVIHGEKAGSVTVTLDATERATEVGIVYELTALSEAGARHLEQFADGYGEYRRSWQDAIERWKCPRHPRRELRR